MAPFRTIARYASLVGLLCCARAGLAMAFPDTDESNPPLVPTGADLTQPDVQDLSHQMGLTSGFASLGSAQGWIIVPRLSAEEAFTDNVNEVPSPRRWDLTTIIGPGVSVLGDSDRAQLRLDYEPDLELHLRTGPQNVLGQQLNTVGTLTIVPDVFYVDVRGLAGVQATNGGIGGLGGLGQGGIGGITANSVTPATTGTIGLARQNRSETSSFSVSPYALFRFGDLATARLAVSLTRSNTELVTGFAPLPFVDEGSDNQSLSTIEESAQIQTGDRFNQFRDTFSADASQGTGSGAGVNSATRDTVNNRIDYQINTSFDIYGQLGWEDFDYSGSNALAVHDVTWQAGTVFTPNPDVSVTVGYGHQNDANTAIASGRYALTARTILTGSYTNGIGTQLEQVANQLNLAAVGNNGNLVNAQTGGQLFSANNALGVEAGVYRYNTLTVGLTSVLDRDTVTVTVSHSQQTRVGAGAPSTTTNVTTPSFSWTHLFNPDFSGSVVASYNQGSAIAGADTNSVVAALSLQYNLSETVSVFARYNYYNVQSSAAGQSWYQDLVLVGITKQF
ncbi:MAG TPA: hypothetical protein VMB73_16870 [Acetobacteraceae bacterium]|nr:hypothetical protein [Acetobacteraceae bacterium]